jgi:cell division protein FtsB
MSNESTGMFDLQRQLGMQSNLYYAPTDRRTKRERLDAKLAANQAQIDRLLAENEEIKQALALLDSHSLLEKMDNLITKLLG